MIQASVIICTFNRAVYLTKALKSAVVQDLSESEYEILVIDNNSSDNTKEIVQEFLVSSEAPNIRYVFEGKQGLSNARNKGIKESKGNIVIFLDDDAIADSGWLRAIIEAFDRTDADVVGGKVELLFEVAKPQWLTPHLETFLSKIDRGHKEREITLPQEWLAGANIAFRRTVFDRFPPFDPMFGRKGNLLLSGEETELCLRLQGNGLKIVYTPYAEVYHGVLADRISKTWFRKRAFMGGLTSGMQLTMHQKAIVTIKDIVRSLLNIGFLVTKLFLSELYGAERRMTAELKILSLVGKICGYFT